MTLIFFFLDMLHIQVPPLDGSRRRLMQDSGGNKALLVELERRPSESMGGEPMLAVKPIDKGNRSVPL